MQKKLVIQHIFLQFYLTDSTNHFLRGALYFNTEVNDSIAPVSIFLKDDIKHLIESFRWIEKSES